MALREEFDPISPFEIIDCDAVTHKVPMDYGIVMAFMERQPDGPDPLVFGEAGAITIPETAEVERRSGEDTEDPYIILTGGAVAHADRPTSVEVIVPEPRRSQTVNTTVTIFTRPKY